MPDKLGLVLSGGGAKGAYQVGILKYLAEVGLQPDEIAGTSIGALNASVVSANRKIELASKNLEKIWEQLAETAPLKLDKKKLITSSAVLLSLVPALKLSPLALGGQAIYKASQLAKYTYARLSHDYKKSLSYKIHQELNNDGLLQSTPVIDLLSEHASTERIINGLPLYVSVYESDGSFNDVFNYLKGSLAGLRTKNSNFCHAQALPEHHIHEVIMASASLPFLFQSRTIDGINYRDGGMGGVIEQQGNTPIQPLIDSGCNYVIVSLLDDGSTFDRNKFPNCTIIEVRPKDFISASMCDMVAFEPEKIKVWIEQGYYDAERCIGNVINALMRAKFLTESEKLRNSVLDALDNDNFDI